MITVTGFLQPSSSRELGIVIYVITPPRVPIRESLDRARDVFSPIGIDLVPTRTFELTSPNQQPLYQHIDVDGCTLGSPISNRKHSSLHGIRHDAGRKGVAIYFVRSTTPPVNGCSQHPPNTPGALITTNATKWTLAHEIGHVLGLFHCSKNNALMSPATTSITDKPSLSFSEVQTLLRSPWLT
ncbi:matrixin family metalloprotease [Streptomyces sp. NPDC054834]